MYVNSYCNGFVSFVCLVFLWLIQSWKAHIVCADRPENIVSDGLKAWCEAKNMSFAPMQQGFGAASGQFRP